MAETKKYADGQVFISTRFDNEAFVITGKQATGKVVVNKKGAITQPKSFVYLIEQIPDEVILDMPNGSKWTHKRQSFTSNDDIIDKEISLGNWEMIND